MKNLIAVIIIAALLLPACKKEIILSPAEQTAVELQEVIAKNGIKRVLLWGEDNSSIYPIYPNWGLVWVFSNGFYIDYNEGASPRSLNLLFLESYEIRNMAVNDGTYSLTLLLFFKKDS